MMYLIKELLGLTNADSKFVYLSDGGHFENLGIYELVRRRCQFIVACDAGQDGAMNFGDLGNAIEKCRTDFGVDIEIDIESIRQKNREGWSPSHCSIGRIRYDKVYENAPVGTLVYLKSSLTGDEATDVKRYAAGHPEFPHQPTSDQWFDESQFESYRELGYHTIMSVFGKLCRHGEIGALEPRQNESAEELFFKLRQSWYPRRSAASDTFTKHSNTLGKIFEDIASNKDLEFLDSEIYPQWRSLNWLPDDHEKLRQGFYLCNRMIQLMEDVYHDLNLEEEQDHPDNRGWINLFRHWSWTNIFRLTWTLTASTYGIRFQLFCKRVLDIDPGRVVATELPPFNGADEQEVDKRLRQARADALLNYLEVDIIKDLMKKQGHLIDRIYLLQIQFRDPIKERQMSRLGKEKCRDVDFTVGFALVNAKDEVVHCRIQDHLRGMGLSRKCSLALIEIGLETLYPEPIVDQDNKDAQEEYRRFERTFQAARKESDKRSGSTQEDNPN